MRLEPLREVIDVSMREGNYKMREKQVITVTSVKIRLYCKIVFQRYLFFLKPEGLSDKSKRSTNAAQRRETVMKFNQGIVYMVTKCPFVSNDSQQTLNVVNITQTDFYICIYLL